uniref:TIL domain-containing protein n=1 Tax=Caenorhabditis tropicalis TaxID=1561998 RepID=A0A1I7T1S0_9PELO
MLRSFLLLLLLPLLISAEYPCPDGLYNIKGRCLAPICINNPVLPPCVTNCPAGQWPSQHLCVPKAHCPDDQAAWNGTCVSQCTSPSSTNCVLCAPPRVLAADLTCKKCPPGTRPTNNLCVYDCPENTVWGEDRCVSSCDWSQQEVNGACENVCSTGQYLYGSQCRNNCNGLFYHEDLCVEVCPAGFIVENGNYCVHGNTLPFG